ncbi:hypothetical protein SLE2022_378470 [Rubroshorea leprosula]
MVWQGVVDGLGILKLGSTWRIGTGQDIRLWRDNWLPSGAIPRPRSALIQQDMDDRVSAFIDVNTSCWKEGDVRQQFCAEDAESILHIPLSRSCSVDRLIWLGTNNGKFSVKSAYKYAWELIFGTQHHAHDQILKPVWRSVWSLNVPSKLKHVLWRIIWEILPSRDILQSRGLEIEHDCGICGEAEESYFHLFFDCAWSKAVWREIFPAAVSHSIQQSTFLDGFLDFFLALSSDDRELVAVTLWSIWNNRNHCIYKHSCYSPARSIRAIKCYIAEYRAATTQVDDNLQEILPQPGPTEDVWTPPPSGVFKINVDASIPPQSGTASLGVVLRDSNGGVLGAGKKTISFQGSVDHAEALAISFGMQLGKEFGCKNVVVESDSKNAVQAIASSEECFLVYGAVVEEIRERTSLFDSYSFSFARRALNEIAHRIAHMHSPLPPWEGVWVGTLPLAIGTDLVS